VPLIAIEEHWIMPELTAALNAMPEDLRDQSLAFNELGDHQARLQTWARWRHGLRAIG
jgi:uncharacterized protein